MCKRVVFFTLLIMLSPATQAILLDVSIDTSPLTGISAQLAFDLIDGDFVVNNTATVSDFSTDGALGVASSVGDVTGTLPGVTTIGDTSFFNEYLQPITLGSSIAFTLDLTDNNAGGFFLDSFSFFVLDASGFLPLFSTTDPFGTDSLFAIDITGAPGGDLQIFSATDIPALMTWTVTPSSVPEPGTIALLCIALLCIGLMTLGKRREMGIF